MNRPASLSDLAGLLGILAISIVLAATLFAGPMPHEPTVVGGPDPAALSQAIDRGGLVTLAFDGTVPLSETLRISKDTTIDARGRRVTLDGASEVRHFVVAPGATLRLINLQLVNGRFVGADGRTNQPGMPAYGGSIYNDGGVLELIGCAFSDNEAIGGTGGPWKPGWRGGMMGGEARGGAVYSANGRLAITNCVFAGNQALGGRGENGELYSGGGGDSFGGALYSTNGRSVLTEAFFTNNLARGGAPWGVRPDSGGGVAHGGAVADADETVTILNCRFSGNQSLGGTRFASEDNLRETGTAKGAGVFHGKGAMTITDTLFETNSAIGGRGWDRRGPPIFGDGQGGAVWNGADLNIENSSFVSNQATGGDAIGCCEDGWAGDGKGGGIFNDGLLNLVNCTLVGNTARGGLGDTLWSTEPGAAHGGALFVQSGTVSLLNVTVAGNQAESHKEAVAASVAVAQGSVICTNTILSCVPGQTNVSGSVIDGGYNICSDASAAFSSPSSRKDLDPRLGDLGRYGGATPVIRLLPDSPAVDSGDTSASPVRDQRGVPRPKGLTSDIGAFELAPSIFLTSSDDGGLAVEYRFKANETNRVSASTDLADWHSLGTRVADHAGNVELERVYPSEIQRRFYRVQVQAGP